ncbi:hypothetical protein HII36_40740 [Nonomuraea sp. NN258]|uniref:hypothetical protein n=1 Tax=Nonomuraea antri TaxID=2730852 RepID=UPI001568AEA5|nr:hypothetical protein [Nonomuraea antri]NRQ38114.1 hypothetical protein [Nonomuraea antri]
MTDLESRLRDTLSHASELAPRAPHGLPGRIAAGSRRRGRRTRALVMGVAAAALAVPIALTSTGGTGGDRTGAVVEDDFYTGMMSDNPPVGDVQVLDNPSEKRSMLLWFARRPEGELVLCEITRSRGGGGSGTCDRPVGDDDATMMGETGGRPEPDAVMYYGTVKEPAARIKAVTEDGPDVDGRLHRPAGAPRAIWTVTVPATADVASFEFFDSAGARFAVAPNIYRDHRPPRGERAGDPVPMPGGLTAELVRDPAKTLLWTLAGRDVGSHVVDGDHLMTDLGGGRMPVELVERAPGWFGIADRRTVRVDLVFADGSTASAATRPDPWQLGIRLFAGTHERTGDIYLEGFEVVGYDAAGREIWRDPHPAEKPPSWSGGRP